MKPSLQTPSRRSRIESGALLAVIALLCALAVVQHRWLGAIAEAERRKLTEEATEKAQAIAQDVDRELTRAFLELRIDAKSLPGRQAPEQGPDDECFAARFERWRTESPHAGLVRGVYVVDRSDTAPSRLLHFDPASAVFAEEPWPDSLARVRVVIEADRDTPLPLPIPVSASFPPVMAEVPALLAPILDIVVSERFKAPPAPDKLGRIREMFLRHSGRGPIEIVLLDAAYLKDTLLSATARTRLGTDSPFDWSVVRSGDGVSVAGAPATSSASDAKASMLRLRFDDLDRSLLRGIVPGLTETTPDSAVRFVVQLGRPPANAHAGPGNVVSSAPWTLQLRHREGSIDAAVRSQQIRNTALSGSILGVLGLSAGLVFVSARRLRAVAAQQVEFVAAVSHELRTPLAVIRSAADNLADGVIHDPGQARRYGALIRDEGIRLTDMVEHVLEFAGADSPARASRGPVDLTEAARAAASGMSALAADRHATLTIDAADQPLQVNGDSSHLTRAISNLLGNALKYGGEPPRVTLRLRRAEGMVEVAVSDEGQGLSAAEVPRLFEPFYRGQRASEAQIPGSGLGLALVKRIVESHGGRVTAANATGGGALFTITLPAA